MKNISFALTEAQILQQTKMVTRRLRWLKLKAGDVLQPVNKCMGLKKGEKPRKLGCPIRVLSVRRETLNLMIDDAGYGFTECTKEGFRNTEWQWPAPFVAMFCRTHKGCTPDTEITRIEFEFTEPLPR